MERKGRGKGREEGKAKGRQEGKGIVDGKKVEEVKGRSESDFIRGEARVTRSEGEREQLDQSGSQYTRKSFLNGQLCQKV